MFSTFSKSQSRFLVFAFGLLLIHSCIQPSVALAKQTDQALFITNYECGPPKMELKDIEDFSCHAFTVTDTSWSLEKALTVSASVPVFSRSIFDIAPELKGHVYVGLDSDNRLSVFEGNPKEGHILQRLDRLSIPALQRSIPHTTFTELQQGIQIQTIEEYRSILSTFLRYSDPS
jgi:forespore regulator of the sigma-K checkpoint